MDARTSSSLLPAAVAAASGIVFGLGLGISEMLTPARVLGFLDIAGMWDPTLVFVMGGALLVTFPAFFYMKRMPKPVCETTFVVPSRRDIDGPLVQGAVLFGIGWGLIGLCPGPAIAGLASLNIDVLLFFAAMVVGMLLFRLLPN